jgi:hypothetical protein
MLTCFSGAVAAGSILDDDMKLLPEVTLGPGQIHPRGYRLTTGHYGEIKLGLLMTKGQLEVEVVCARNIACEARESLPGNKQCLANSFRNTISTDDIIFLCTVYDRTNGDSMA